MTTLPIAGFFTDPARLNSEAKQGHDDDIAVIRELLGGEAESTLTIAAGSVTPDRAIHAIDTEAAASTDDLANIDQTNHPDGRLLMIRAANASRTVVVKHLAGGAGQVRLADAADFPLDDADKLLLLRRLGAQWEEITRAFAADKAAARTFLGFTGAGGKVAAADLAADALKLNALPQAIFVADHTVVAGDVGTMLIANKATAITFPLTAAATLGTGFVAFIKNIGAGVLTIDPNGAETIDGVATLVLKKGEWTKFWTEGTAWRSLGAMGVGGGITRYEVTIDAEMIIPVGGINPPLTRQQTATNAITYETRDFDQTSIEDAQFQVRSPLNWDLSAITIEIIWTALAGTGDVRWRPSAFAAGDDDAIDTAILPSAAVALDTLIAAEDVHIISVTNTPVNTPAAGDIIFFNIRREANNATDTLNADANLIAVRLKFTTTA